MKQYIPFCEPQNEFERRIYEYESLARTEEITFLDPPGQCDLCDTSFENMRFMVDTCLERNRNPWGCICAECFFKHELEIGWGKGQLFTHLKKGEWLLTAGDKEIFY